MHIKFFSIEYTKLNDIIKSNHKINIRRDLIMSFYKKMVSVCAAVALSTSIIPVIPVSADTGMTRYEAERQYTGGWADVVQNSIASGGYVVERIGGKSTDIGTVVFKIWAEEAGTYNAKLGYISKKDSDFYVRVNWYAWDTGNDTKFTTTASNSVQTQEMTLKLNAGWNDVKIYSTKGITDDGTDYRISVDYLDVDTEGYTLPNITEDTKATLNNTSHRDIYKASDGSGITGLGQSGSADFIVKADEDGAYNLGIAVRITEHWKYMLIMFLLILYIALLPTKAIESILLWYSLLLRQESIKSHLKINTVRLLILIKFS